MFRNFRLILIGSIIFIHLWFVFATFYLPAIVLKVKTDQHNQWIIDDFRFRDKDLHFGLSAGERIVQINSTDAEIYFTKHKSEVNLGDTIITASSLENSKTVKIDSLKTLKYDILQLFVAMITCMIGLLLYFKMPNSKPARYLSYVFFTMTSVAIDLGVTGRGDKLGNVFMYVAICLLPIIFLHFLMVFFREKGSLEQSSHFMKYLYIGIGFIFILSVISRFTHTFHIAILTPIILIIFMLGIFFNLFYLFYIYWKYRKSQSHLITIIKTVVFSTVISFAPIILFSFMPSILFDHEWINSVYMMWFILIFPISFAYLIAAKKLYDIDAIVRRLFIAATVSLVPSLLFSVLFKLFVLAVTFEMVFISFFIMFVSLTTLIYSLEYVKDKLDEALFPRRHFLKASMKKIAKKLESVFNFNDLKTIILADLVDTLQVFGGAIVFKYSNSTEIISEGEIDLGLVELIMQSESFDNEDYSCFEVNRNEEYSSYLIMSPRRTNTKLGTEEVQWLNLIISYLAVSLENVFLIRKLDSRLQELASQLPNESAAQDFNWFRKLTFEMQERERTRIAMDLHDSTMQDLFYINRKLDQFIHNFQVTPEAVKFIKAIREHIEIVNDGLRQSCFELHPYLIQDVGLLHAVEAFIRKGKGLWPFRVKFEAVDVSETEKWELGRKKHVFRLVQEMINNAYKHSEASNVNIKMSINDGCFWLEYDDDGVGFDDNRPPVQEIRMSGMGIEQMKSRVLHLHGQINISTSKMSGVRIQIMIPLAE